MNTITKKAIAYICYKRNDGTTEFGTFDEIPMDAFLGIINLQIPYINETGELKYKEYMHRIYCGDDIPASIFLKAYEKTISKEKIDYIKKEMEKGFNTIVIPLSKSTEFAFLTKEDQLCRTRDEFEELILEFQRQTNDVLDLIVPEENTPTNKM